MKNDSSNLFYSFDVGLIHFVSYNTEVYFNMTGNGAASGDGNDCVKTQYGIVLRNTIYNHSIFP